MRLTRSRYPAVFLNVTLRFSWPSPFEAVLESYVAITGRQMLVPTLPVRRGGNRNSTGYPEFIRSGPKLWTKAHRAIPRKGCRSTNDLLGGNKRWECIRYEHPARDEIWYYGSFRGPAGPGVTYSTGLCPETSVCVGVRRFGSTESRGCHNAAMGQSVGRYYSMIPVPLYGWWCTFTESWSWLYRYHRSDRS